MSSGMGTRKEGWVQTVTSQARVKMLTLELSKLGSNYRPKEAEVQARGDCSEITPATAHSRQK